VHNKTTICPIGKRMPFENTGTPVCSSRFSLGLPGNAGNKGFGGLRVGG